MTSHHEFYMRRGLQLASLGKYTCRPNPMVGCVIVVNDRIIGEGFHYRAGEAHAEVNAIESVKDREKLKEATLYVTLEPCAHHGRTPPCSERLIAEGIPKVVSDCRDQYAEVNGAGIRKLKEAGIEVIEGVLEKEAEELNRAFFTYHREKRPFITLKWAQTLDGFMDAKREDGASGQFAISGSCSKVWVHQLRAGHDGILIGSRTALNDAPRLNVRHFYGHNPCRIVIDPNYRVPSDNPVFRDGDYFHVYEKAEGNLLHQLLEELHVKGLQSVLVEGGPTTLQHFLSEGLWDEILCVTAPRKLHDGLRAPELHLAPEEQFRLGKDTVTRYCR